ncbi:MAG: hypothetical protein ACFE8B_01415 [Candidatus Hermodarchaeota archaeon]
MIFIELDKLTQLSGVLGLISVSIAWIYGLIALYKFINTKEIKLFYFFLAVIFTISPWYPSGLGYLYWLITREELSYPVYVLLGTIGVPIALFSWLQIYMPMLHPKQKHVVTLISACLSLMFYLYLFFFVFFAQDAPIDDVIGIKRNPIDIDYKGFILVFLAISLLISTITGNDFSIASLKEKDNPIIRWKGRFLILSFNFFAIGAIGDGFITLTPLTLIIFRIFLVLSSTFYYFGFILPKWLQKIMHLK